MKSSAIVSLVELDGDDSPRTLRRPDRGGDRACTERSLVQKNRTFALRAGTFHCRLCRDTEARRPRPWAGVRRPAVAVPRRGGTAGHLEIAAALISTRLLEVISRRPLEMPEVQGNGHFQMSKAISMEMTLAWAFGNRRPSLARSIELRLAACHNLYPS